ncbi:MAG: aldo/keto reductase [Coriobacteriales bacterium]|nr:aldo/keto reductase [Coriobacteriales bacterium]
MQYRTNPKNGDRISQLAFGCMRFPTKGGNIDQEQVDLLVAHAIEQGINYFDTAYLYQGSEEALGKALAKTGARNRVFIATKLPVFFVRKAEDLDKYFDKQLERLQTDHIDYYFMHNMSDIELWSRLKGIGIEAWIEQKKATGQLRNVGYSYHGGRIGFKEILDSYPWDFCMLQYNYLDENSQAGITGVRAIAEKGLPVFVMEPLRGGKLVDTLPDKALEAFRAVHPEWSPAEWGLRWVLDQSMVTFALSGMSSMQQLKDNLKIAEAAHVDCLGDAEFNAYARAVAAILHVTKVPCTACGYCLPCPAGVDIPTCFADYNESYSRKRSEVLTDYFMHMGYLTPRQHDASQCTGCGACEAHCPQHIEIRNELANVSKRFYTALIKPFLGIARKFINPKKA